MDLARQVSHTQRGVSHTLQRTDVLIKTFELQIFRVGIAGPPKVPLYGPAVLGQQSLLDPFGM